MDEQIRPSYEELAHENEELRSAIYSMMEAYISQDEDEMARSMESAESFDHLLAEMEQLTEE